MDGAEDRTLRAKYLDWCSARIAEQFLDLSPEEIYGLAYPVSTAVDAAAGGAPERPTPATLPEPMAHGYRELVQRVTESLLERMSLPTLEQWSEAYAESPGRFDAEMLGFWKDAVEEAFEGPEDRVD